MSRHKSFAGLRHMLDYAREAVAMASGKTRTDLDVDRKLNLAVRLLEIDKARPLLLAAFSREPSDAAAVCQHAAEDRGAAVTGWIRRV
jgi:hypothetical protein